MSDRAARPSRDLSGPFSPPLLTVRRPADCSSVLVLVEVDRLVVAASVAEEHETHKQHG